MMLLQLYLTLLLAEEWQLERSSPRSSLGCSRVLVLFLFFKLIFLKTAA